MVQVMTSQTERQRLRTQFAQLKRHAPHSEECREVGRLLAYHACRERLDRLDEQDRRIVVRRLVGPTEWN
jgi:hypothetical protein